MWHREDRDCVCVQTTRSKRNSRHCIHRHTHTHTYSCYFFLKLMGKIALILYFNCASICCMVCTAQSTKGSYKLAEAHMYRAYEYICSPSLSTVVCFSSKLCPRDFGGKPHTWPREGCHLLADICVLYLAPCLLAVLFRTMCFMHVFIHGTSMVSDLHGEYYRLNIATVIRHTLACCPCLSSSAS